MFRVEVNEGTQWKKKSAHAERPEAEREIARHEKSGVGKDSVRIVECDDEPMDANGSSQKEAEEEPAEDEELVAVGHKSGKEKEPQRKITNKIPVKKSNGHYHKGHDHKGKKS